MFNVETISDKNRTDVREMDVETRNAIKGALNGGTAGQFGMQPGKYTCECVKVTVRRKGESVSCFAHMDDGRYIYLPSELGAIALDNAENVPFSVSVTVSQGTPRISKDQNGLPAISLLHPVTGFEPVGVEETTEQPDAKAAANKKPLFAAK